MELWEKHHEIEKNFSQDRFEAFKWFIKLAQQGSNASYKKIENLLVKEEP